MFIAAEVEDVGGGHVRVDAKAGAGDARAAEFLGEDGVIFEVNAGAPVFFRGVGAEEAVRAGFQPDFARYFTVFFPLAVIGSDFRGDEFFDGVTELLMFFGKNISRDHVI